MALADKVLSITALEKRYGQTRVLNQLHLSVSRGAIHGLVGLNGSGKTTTLECVLGMQRFDAGELQVMGHSPANLWRARGDVVGIFDSPSLHPAMTVRQVLEHARLICPNPARTPAEVETMLGISRYSKYRIRQLSLGNRRRASIAHALIGRPQFVVLDEPFNGLDAGGVDDVLALIGRLNRDEGTSFLLSSHQLAYLETVCTHLAILHKGSIVTSDKVETLFNQKKTQLVLSCDREADARSLLHATAGITSVTEVTDELGNGFHLLLDGADPAAINTMLVHAGIAVSRLELKKPSLSQLFHDIVEAN